MHNSQKKITCFPLLTLTNTFFPAILYFPSPTFLIFNFSQRPLEQLQFFCIRRAASCTFLSNSFVGVVAVGLGVSLSPDDSLFGGVTSKSGSSPLPKTRKQLIFIYKLRVKIMLYRLTGDGIIRSRTLRGILMRSILRRRQLFCFINPSSWKD